VLKIKREIISEVKMHHRRTESEVEIAAGGSGGALETLATAAVDGGSSHGVNSSHGSPLSTDLCIDESGWYVVLLS